MSAYEGSFEMADDMDIDEIRVRRRLLAYTDAVASETSADHRHIARRAMGARSASSLRGLVAAVVVIGLVALVARAGFPGAGTMSGRPPAPSCQSGGWPPTPITCESVFRVGNQAGARVERARIWLTTLGAVKAAMGPRQQAVEPSETARVWVIVYDGLWRCCPNAFDQTGNLIPQVDQTRWLVVAEAGKEGTGFIYLQDWSEKSVPDALPAPDR
jgi:hypothetical protein